MKLCSYHFHDLDHAIRRKGMGRLIDPPRAEAFARRWLDGTAVAEEFDPLVVADFEIKAKTVQLGIRVINGSCPLCETNRQLARLDAADAWIDNVSDLMLLVAKTNHLVL